MLILAHMDVVDALPSDWTTDPFKLVEKDGYFYGRGSGDDKGGLVPSLVALLNSRRQASSNRDIIILFTGDEETQGKGAELGATEWRKWTEAEFALNADGGGGAFTRDGKPLGFGLQTSRRPSRPIISARTIRAATARGPGLTMRSTTSPMR